MQTEANLKDDWISCLCSKFKLTHQTEFSQITMPQGFSLVQHVHPIVRHGSFTVSNKQFFFLTTLKNFKPQKKKKITSQF